MTIDKSGESTAAGEAWLSWIAKGMGHIRR
jgi:hypothetical protein